MINDQQLKEIVKQKYSEIAQQDKDVMFMERRLVVNLVVVKYEY